MCPTSPGNSCSTSTSCSIGWHKLFAHTSWSVISGEQVDVFKSFARGGKACSVGFDHKHIPYLLWGPLLEAVKPAEYIEILVWKCKFTAINPSISFDKTNNISAKHGCDDKEPVNNQVTIGGYNSSGIIEQLQSAILWQEKSTAHITIQEKQWCSMVSRVYHCAAVCKPAKML